MPKPILTPSTTITTKCLLNSGRD